DGQHVAVCLAFHVVVRDTLSIRVDVEQGHAVFVELNHSYYLLPLSVLTKSPPTYSLGDAPRPFGPSKLQMIQNKTIILVVFVSPKKRWFEEVRISVEPYDPSITVYAELT